MNRHSPVSADAGVRRRLVVVSAVAVALAAIAVSTLVIALRLTGGDDSSGRAGPSMYGVSGTHIGSMMGGRTALSEEAYLREMVAHHREAVSAAQQLARSHRPELRAFGAAVVRVQSAQIRSMRRWLRDWYPHTPSTEDYQPMMKNLTHVTGDRLDRTFLHDMIEHHMAAVMMSQRLLLGGRASHDGVRRLAETIRDQQSAEIVQMNQWLETWFPNDTSAGTGMGPDMPGSQ